MLARVALGAALLLGTARANQPDVLFPHYHAPAECAKGCAAWSTAPAQGEGWDAAAAGKSCAIPGGVTGAADKVKTPIHAWEGPFCFCADASGKATKTAGYCMPPLGFAEQINLQLASDDVVIASYVTYEAAKPTSAPEARFGTSESSMRTVSGVTHWYTESTAKTKDGAHTGRNFSMHFVRLGPLKPRTKYFYAVKGGTSDWSATASFRSAYTAADGGTTRVGIFGDMAITQFNAVGNLAADCASGVIDAIWMMGDHACKCCRSLCVFLRAQRRLHRRSRHGGRPARRRLHERDGPRHRDLPVGEYSNACHPSFTRRSLTQPQPLLNRCRSSGIMRRLTGTT